MEVLELGRLSPALLLAVWLAMTGCAGEAPEPAVEVPERIIAVAPSLVEVVFGLGLGDQVVGVGDYALWPPEVFSKPRLGGLFDVRLEAIVELDPDLAILLPGEEKLAAQLRELGVEVLTVRHETLDDIERSMLVIGERLGVEAVGAEMASRFRAELEYQPLPARGTVLLAITREAGNLGEVLVAGSGTFYDELLEHLGVYNAFAGSKLTYPQVSAEGILRSGAQAVIELQPRRLSSEGDRRLLSDWYQLSGLPAVQQDCLRVVAGDHVLLPGPRVTRLLSELREVLATCPAFSE